MNLQFDSMIEKRAIKWGDSDPPRVRSGSERICADYWRTSSESARCNFPTYASGPAVDSAGVRREPKIVGGFAGDPPQIRGRAVDLFVTKKNVVRWFLAPG